MLLAPERLQASRTDSGFLSKYAALLDMSLRGGDLVIVVVTAVAAYGLRFHTLTINPAYRTAIVLAVLLAAVIFPWCHIYRSWRGDSLVVEVLRVWLAWALAFLALFVLGWMLKATGTFSRVWAGYWFAGGTALFALHRLAARKILRFARAHGVDIRKVLLVGATDAGRKIVAATRNNPWMGLEVVGYIATPYDDHGSGIDGMACLGNLEQLVARGDGLGSDQLWIALPMTAANDIHRLSQAFLETAITVRLIPDLVGYSLLNQESTELAGVPIITLRGSRITGRARIVKGIEDRVLSALILLLVSPLMLVLAIGVKLSSPGPVLFKQKRHGVGGAEVEVWKFRSMRMHHEATGVVTQAKHDDPRVTPLGRIMRRLSLDELPQFFNVLTGSMSIVGPRPHAVEHDLYYKHLVPGYVQRNQVKPGITGWAQVNGLRGETKTIDMMAARVDYDIAYVQSWSLALDLRIVARTAVMALFCKNAY